MNYKERRLGRMGKIGRRLSTVEDAADKARRALCGGKNVKKGNKDVNNEEKGENLTPPPCAYCVRG